MISVKVGPNSLFTPNSKVNILECADPDGKSTNLPTDDSKCDGNTVQGDTILVAKDGSFSESSYTVYQLPSTTLAEQPNFQPICNQTHQGVFYVGQNEDDFTAPKLFSAPFTVGPSSAVTATTSPTQSTAPGATPTTANSQASATANASRIGDSPAVSLSSGPDTAVAGTLPDTGPPARLEWMLGLGLTLLLGGTLGRRISLRAQR
jgi:hypothetical protein